MPQGSGLGYVSQDVKDVFRELKGDLSLKDPNELKPPYRVKRIITEAPAGHLIQHLPIDKKRYELLQDVSEENPIGVLNIKMRLQDESIAITDIAKGPYMKWAIAESLSECFYQLCGVPLDPKEDILFCMDEVKVLDTQMPYSGTQVWQLCDFRFDYMLKIDPQMGQAVVDYVFQEMATFERMFCKALETRFRDIYHLTILGLSSKQYALTSGETNSNAKALFEAAQRNDVTKIKDLVEMVDVNFRPKESAYPKGTLGEELGLMWVDLGRTALLGAAEEGHVEAMRALLDAKADVNFQDNSGFHALYLGAGANDSEKVVKFLTSWGADVKLKNKSGYTALHNACGSGEVGGIKALLEAKADLSVKSNTGAAPIHVAVINNQPAALEVLAASKANMNMPAFGGNTPVHEAVMANNPDLIQKLFDLKADINIESGPEHKFATPLQMALDRKRKKAAKKLQALGAKEKIDGHDYEEAAEGEAPKVKGRIYV